VASTERIRREALRQRESPTPYTTREIGDEEEARKSGHAYLRYRDGGRAFRIFRLDPTHAALDVGRAGGNDLRIAWDDMVSNRHAQLRYGAGVWSIVDAGSSNGTRVNRRPVLRERRLHHGDELRFGLTTVIFQDPGRSVAPTGALPDDQKLLHPRNEKQRKVLVELARPFFEWTAAPRRWPRPATREVIARRLGLKPTTVRDYLHEFYKQAGLQRGEDDQPHALAELAIDEGVVSEDDYPELV
jgi:pSer/pThr/pTyr-binding forkhead associated (FHA) protein